MSILNQIEDKLYRANFKTELLRQQFYLAVHATLTKNKDVPRFYALSKQLNEEELDQLFSNLLFSDSNYIAENTNKLLSHLHISTKQLNSLSQEEKDEIINTVEYVLLNGWGKGIILYDNLRVKPNNSCDLLNYLNNQEVFKTDKYLKLNKVLNTRLFESKKILSELNNVFTKGERKYNPSILSKSYELILEKIWKLNWNNNNNYNVINADKELLSNLIFMEEI